MYLLLYILYFIHFVVVINAQLENIQNRIVGGDRVKYRHEFPYQISLRARGQHICGGTIYKSHYVITAAHCVDNLTASRLEVVAGDLSLKHPTKYTQKSKVAEFYKNSAYNSAMQNDVAVLRLKKDLIFNDYVQNISIWNSSVVGEDPGRMPQCVVSGWGSDAFEGNVKNDLRSAKVTLIASRYCESVYLAMFKPPGMICAGNVTHSRDACSGDSGGPLVCNGQLYGIVSWGIKCGNPSYPGVYTNADYYRQWIDSIANNAEGPISSHLQSILIIPIGWVVLTSLN